MSVRSAMFPPKSVPIPIPGSPLRRDIRPMSPSGSADTTATSKKLVTNSVDLRNFAMCSIDLTAYSALFTSTRHAMMNSITSLYIKYQN